MCIIRYFYVYGTIRYDRFASILGHRFGPVLAISIILTILIIFLSFFLDASKAKVMSHVSNPEPKAFINISSRVPVLPVPVISAPNTCGTSDAFPDHFSFEYPWEKRLLMIISAASIPGKSEDSSFQRRGPLVQAGLSHFSAQVLLGQARTQSFQLQVPSGTILGLGPQNDWDLWAMTL